MYDADFIMLLTNLSCMTVLHQWWSSYPKYICGS